MAKKLRNGQKVVTRPGTAKFVTSMDPDEQNFKECVSLFIYNLVLGCCIRNTKFTVKL